MNLVNDVDAVAPIRRRVLHLLPDIADIFHTIVGCRIDLHHIEGSPSAIWRHPTAFLWSACMMLEYLGENETAGRIRKAVDEVLAEGKHLTRDLHGTATTEEYVDAVIARL